jgi:NitT/TauT family transport system substrate-binding protein
MRKNRILFALVSVFAIVLASCSSCTRKPDHIKIGYVPYSSGTPFFVAMEKGLFKANNLEVEAIKFQTANEVMNALLHNDIDGIGGIGFPTYFAIEQNTQNQFKVIWCAVETEEKSVNSLLVLKDSTLSSIEQLKGKKVGTFTGSTQVMNVKAFLKRFMDPDKDVQIIQISPQLQIQALASKQFDTLFSIEPIPTIAVEQGIARVLVDNPRCKYIMNPFPAGAGVISTKFAEGHPDLAKRLTQAMNSAIDAIRADEPGAKALLPKYTPIDASIAQKSRLYYWWKTDEIDSQTIQKLADIMTQWGELSKKVDTTKMVYVTK